MAESPVLIGAALIVSLDVWVDAKKRRRTQLKMMTVLGIVQEENFRTT
jgi:hypothetical protein